MGWRVDSWARQAAFACLLSWLVIGPAAAALRELPAGTTVTLGPQQGVLAIAVDAGLPVDDVHLRAIAAERDSVVLADLPIGRRVAFYIADAGRYGWLRLRAADGAEYMLGNDPEFRFDVKAGVVNYPGDLVYRPSGSGRAVLHVANRALGVLDALRDRHPALLERPFVHAGHYPDPFPAFYRDELAGHREPLPAPSNADPLVFDRASLPIPVGTLWREPALQRVALSPDGRWLARHRRQGDCSSIELVELHSLRTHVLDEMSSRVQEIGWASDHQLVVGSGDPDAQQVTVFAIEPADGELRVDRLQVPYRGHVVDLLPLVPDRLLFARRQHGQVAVYRLDIGSQRALDRHPYDWQQRLNRGIDGDFQWLADAKGRLRVAQSADRHGASVLYHADHGAFEEVLRGHDENRFQPMQLSADGALIYGLSEADREQRELVALDPGTGAMTTVFGRHGIEIVAPLFDLQRRLMGVSYVEQGRLVTRFLGPADAGLDRQLQQHFPDRSIRLLDRDQSGRHLILAVEASDQPEAIYHFDRSRNRAQLIESARPWLAAYPLAPSRLLSSRSVDGLEIESYLTLPAGERPRPLVVMPHGGPIGIRNLRKFDPEVQFLASLGYAVLQVNFRGSAGFGRAFREAGHAELGGLIEDDISSAIDAALASQPLDAERICLLGSSYGGYSSMMMALRWPDRFRCVGSIAGFSDRLLQFTASDSGRSAEVRTILETFMGDPDTGLERMLATSPLYRYEDLDLPLLLAHGSEDLRVDYEQTRRLVRMLRLAGRDPTVVTLYGEAHSVDMPHNREKLWHAVATFLRRHLGDPHAATNAVAAR